MLAQCGVGGVGGVRWGSEWRALTGNCGGLVAGGSKRFMLLGRCVVMWVADLVRRAIGVVDDWLVGHQAAEPA